MKAFVNKDDCIGCELCASDHPDVFSMDSDGLAVAIEAELDGALLEEAQAAVDDCPTSAISVE